MMTLKLRVDILETQLWELKNKPKFSIGQVVRSTDIECECKILEANAMRFGEDFEWTYTVETNEGKKVILERGLI